MKKIFQFMLIACLGVSTQAQVSEISITGSPTLNYTWWDSDTAIKDGFLVGGKLGFGFGQSVELRAVYEKSIDLKNTAEGISFLGQDWIDNNFEERNVDVERWGGELKANLPIKSTLAPYLLLGTGIQKLEIDTIGGKVKEENIYASAGLGIKVKLGNRLTFNVEGKNTVFNLNPSNVIYQGAQDDFDNEFNGIREKRMYNWSIMAGLQLYLGGRNPEKLSALDRAYLRKYSGGLSGFKLILEPGGNYINFDDDSNFKDTYMLGGKAGFDLNRYIGLRAFYYHATKDEEISTDWDEMSMYGGEMTAKLNVGRGVVPYLTLGGGYINVQDDYIGKDNVTSANSSYFARGGLGLILPLSKYFQVFGSANLMYSSERSGEHLEYIQSPSELMTHTMYDVGVKIQLGRSADTDKELDEIINHELDANAVVYQERIAALEEELKEAYKQNDAAKAVEIIQEKKELQEKAEEVGVDTVAVEEQMEITPVEVETVIKEEMITEETELEIALKEAAEEITEEAPENFTEATNEPIIIMSPEELQDLVERVLNGVNTNTTLSTEDRVERLERLLLRVNQVPVEGYREQPQQQPVAPNADNSSAQDAVNNRILEELKSLNNKVDDNAREINKLENKTVEKTIILSDNTPEQVVTKKNTEEKVEVVETEDGKTITTTTTQKVDNDKQPLLTLKGVSAFGGVNFGEATVPEIGLKGHYDIRNTRLQFVPSAFYGFGDETAYGLNADVLYPVNFSRSIVAQPYAGLGLGYNKIDEDGNFGANIIVGTSLNVLDGNLYVDYTSRSFFKNNQLAVGYKYSF